MSRMLVSPLETLAWLEQHILGLAEDQDTVLCHSTLKPIEHLVLLICLFVLYIRHP